MLYEREVVIMDTESLSGAYISSSDRRLIPIDIWDDGEGYLLWIYRETLGVQGIVRAKTFENAYNCVLDEIMSDYVPSEEEIQIWKRNPDTELPEGVHYRNNGLPANPKLKSHLAQEDLNGSLLEPLTYKLAEELNIWLLITKDE